MTIKKSVTGIPNEGFFHVLISEAQINIQGDEPFIQADQIDLLASYLDGKTELATLIKKIDSYVQLNSPSEVKVTFNTQNEALYFSRSIIPFIQKIISKTKLLRLV